MDYPKCLSAARRVKGAEWALADALLEEVGPRGSESRFRDCADYLIEYGIEYKASYLERLHAVARKFPERARARWLTPTLADHAGSPMVVERAEEMAAEEAEETGEEVPITQRYLEKVRKAARRTEGRSEMPERRAPSGGKPKSELQAELDLVRLEGFAGDASMKGRKFLSAIAGAELSARDRDDLLEDVEDVLETWKVVRNAVKNPLSKSIEDFLATQ